MAVSFSADEGINDTELWASDEPVLERSRPRVVHIPSRGLLKGSQHIDPVLAALDARAQALPALVSELQQNLAVLAQQPLEAEHQRALQVILRPPQLDRVEALDGFLALRRVLATIGTDGEGTEAVGLRPCDRPPGPDSDP